MTRLNTASQTFGNSLFSASYSYFGQNHADSLNYALGAVRKNWSEAEFTASVGVFGTGKTIVDIDTEAIGDQALDAAGNTYTTADVWGVARVLGNQVYYGGNTGNKTNGNCGSTSTKSVACLSKDFSVSQTFFTTESSFSVAFVPVKVTASVDGTAHMGLNTSSSTTRYLGMNDTDFASSSAQLSSGAYVTAHLSASAGIAGVFGVGVSSSYRLIDVAITPQANQKYVATSSFGRFDWSNVLPLTITSMSGKVDVWAQTSPFTKSSTTLIDWPGITLADVKVVNASAQETL